MYICYLSLVHQYIIIPKRKLKLNEPLHDNAYALHWAEELVEVDVLSREKACIAQSAQNHNTGNHVLRDHFQN